MASVPPYRAFHAKWPHTTRDVPKLNASLLARNLTDYHNRKRATDNKTTPTPAALSSVLVLPPAPFLLSLPHGLNHHTAPPTSLRLHHNYYPLPTTHPPDLQPLLLPDSSRQQTTHPDDNPLLLLTTTTPPLLYAYVLLAYDNNHNKTTTTPTTTTTTTPPPFNSRTTGLTTGQITCLITGQKEPRWCAGVYRGERTKNELEFNTHIR